MKKLFLITFLFAIIQNHSYSQEGWFLQYANDTSKLYETFFIDTLTGWAVGPGTNLKTTNSGLSWESKNVGYGNTSQDIFFINLNTGWIIGFTYILKTTNGGDNWTPPVFISNSLTRLYFLNENTGFLGDFEKCWKTTNGGANWNFYNLGVTNIVYFSIDFINSNTGWLGGTNGILFKTTNCGLNWIQKSTGVDTRFYGMSFPTVDTGWGVGFNNTGTSRILFTSNGGDNWITQYLNSGVELDEVLFTSNNEGWVVGGPGIILHTSNCGNTWETQDCGVYNILFEGISFVTPEIGWVAGYIGSGNAKIFKTTTGGIVPVENNSDKIPKDFKLFQNYPNPFNPRTVITFQIPKTSQVKLVVFDNTGKEIAVLVNENMNAGNYTVSFEGANLSSGVYFYRLITGEYRLSKSASTTG